ncbi:MAG: carbonic anhydrase [Elusimicrobiota bacterium]
MDSKPTKEDSLRYFAGLLERNEEHARAHGASYGALKSGQRPKVVIAFCSDSRLQTCIFGDSLDLVNNLFVGRDIGNTYSDSEGAVDYALRHLGVPVLFIMGHTGCGAAEAARGDYAGETEAIRARLGRLKTGEDEAHDPEANVDAQVGLALRRYPEKVSSGDLVVIGGVFDLVGHYGGLPGKVYLTNLNGATGVGRIKEGLSRCGAFPDGLLDATVRRLP